LHLPRDEWNHHRQEWSFTPEAAGKEWKEKFQKLDEPYYPKLDMTSKQARRVCCLPAI
jgi:hypothetical protein